jgi:TetR/AcrR family transcriptional regulator, regulator of cefoperazone and chloramphenicol sensitivity
MKPQNKQNNNTKNRLLKSACEVFAKKGYHNATIADICKGAGTNIAAVNYHFRNKKTLYVEAWRQAFHRSLEAYPPDGGVSPDAPAEQRLYGRISSILQRFGDPRNYEVEMMMHKEMANPTGLLTDVIRKSIEPLQEGLRSIVRELLGKSATEEQVLLCQRSIKAQCFDPMGCQRHHGKFEKAGIRFEMTPLNFPVETIAEHITRFSLAGIREVRRQIENGEQFDKLTVLSNVEGLTDEKRAAADGKMVGEIKRTKVRC